MEEKIKIIDQITSRHPSYGTEKGWSWYTGGMKDSGAWHFRKMLDVPIEELQSFLNGIIEEENRPKIPLTEQEEADSKVFVKLADNTYMSVYHHKQFQKFSGDCETRRWFPEYGIPDPQK